MLTAWRRRLAPYTALVLRLALGLVFLWSGLSKVIDIPGAIGVCTNRAEAIDFVSTLYWLPFDPEVFVRLQSVAEIALGLLLVTGLWLELAALLSTVLFLLFFALFNFNVIWKNVGLLGAALALTGFEPDKFSLDSYLRSRKARVK